MSSEPKEVREAPHYPSCSHHNINVRTRSCVYCGQVLTPQEVQATEEALTKGRTDQAPPAPARRRSLRGP